MTVGLVIAIIYISQVVTGESKTGEVKTNIAPKKTKAANVAYDKTVTLDNITPTPTEVMTVDPLVTPTVIPTVISTDSVISPTVILPSVTVAPTINSLLAYNNASVSPTEIILAYNNTTPTVTETVTSSLSATVVKSASLPESGFINNTIIMFVAAGLIIFFSFMF